MPQNYFKQYIIHNNDDNIIENKILSSFGTSESFVCVSGQTIQLEQRKTYLETKIIWIENELLVAVVRKAREAGAEEVRPGEAGPSEGRTVRRL